jgi:hypothetical protein
MSQQSLSCRKCGYTWTPRKAVTRYRRQCPKCNSSELNIVNHSSQTSAKNLPTPMATSKTITFANRTKLPAVVYDLMGITAASSPENALKRAFELFRRLMPYKFKHGLESPEAVFKFLEKEASEGNKRAVEAEERLSDIIENPELVFYECGGDLSAVNWYEAWKKEGYPKDFLDFLNEAANGYWKSQGYELRFREKQDNDI